MDALLSMPVKTTVSIPENIGRGASHGKVKGASVFSIDEPMPCSICYGDIGGGQQAIRCQCGNINHISCGIKVGQCSDCTTDYGDLLGRVNEEAVIRSVEDSKRTAKREVEETVQGDEKDDMLRRLMKKMLNNEITIEEYKLLAKDVKETF